MVASSDYVNIIRCDSTYNWYTYKTFNLGKFAKAPEAISLIWFLFSNLQKKQTNK